LIFYHFSDGMADTDSALGGQRNEINDNGFFV
jgi:hypothetical protein